LGPELFVDTMALATPAIRPVFDPIYLLVAEGCDLAARNH
jgi:hypothetical protein